MSYGGYPGQQSGPPPDHSPQPGYGPPPGQYKQGGYPPQGGHSPQGYPPPQQGYGAPPGGGYPPQQGGYGAPPPQGQWGQPPPQQQGYPPQQGGYGAPSPQGQWGQLPLQQQGYGQAPPPGQYGQAPPPTPPYSGSFPPQQGYPQGGQFPSPQQGGFGPPPSVQYPPQQQLNEHPAPPSPGYDPRAVSPMDMTATATTVHGAIKGRGANDEALIKAVATLDPLQIAGLRPAYMSHMKGDIEHDITGHSSGYYEEGLLAIVRGPLLHDAYCVQRSIKGLGTKERMLNDVLIGRSNADMRAIKLAYQQTFGKDMVAEVAGDLIMNKKTYFGMIMAAGRNEESTLVDPQQVNQHVDRFHEATEARLGTQELRVCEMLTNQSDAQIRAIAQRYGQRYQKPLDAVIRSEFSGHMKEALLLQVARATDRAMSDAIQLEEAMKGVGTKDELLVQRVVRVHWNRQHLHLVKGAYRRKYGVDLVKRVKGETSGKYKHLMVQCLE